LFKKLFDLLPVGIIVYDQNNIIIHTNNCADRITNGDYAVAHYLHNNKPGVKHWDGSHASSPELFKLVVNEKTVVAGCIKYTNEIIGAMVFLIDITGWRFYWDEVKEQQELIRELDDTFNSSYDEILVIDGSGVIKRVNKAGETNYGVPVSDLTGKSIFELEKEGFFSPSVSRMVFEEKKRVTVTQKTKNGKNLIVTGNPIFDEHGGIVRVVVNSRDVSELLNLRKQLADTEQLAESYRRQLLKLNREKVGDRLIARSAQMKRVLEMVDKVAQVDSTVLIMGEPGVGKGVISSRLHKLSKRSGGQFITVNCGAIPEHLLEAELFGCEGGAFTGAGKRDKKGLLELADGGTAFLSDITELPLNLQVKLLRVIQEQKLTRIGGSKPVNVDIRFVAATNRDIQSLVEQGRFREDFYYRLNVIPIIIPPLRYRQEDIPALTAYFMEKLNLKYGTNKKFSREAIEVLQNYNWPGNVSELENLVERLQVTREGDEILVKHLPEYIFESESRFPNRIYVLDICPLKEAVEELEKQLVAIAYNRLQNTYKVAEALAINQSTVVRKIQKYKILPFRERKGVKRKKNKVD